MTLKLPRGSKLLLLCAAAVLLAVAAQASTDNQAARGGGRGGNGGRTGPGSFWAPLSARRLLGVSSSSQWGGGWDSGRRWDRWGNWNSPWSGGWVRMPNMPNIPDDSRFDDSWW